jgi:hypothetical protein
VLLLELHMKMDGRNNVRKIDCNSEDVTTLTGSSDHAVILIDELPKSQD